MRVLFCAVCSLLLAGPAAADSLTTRALNSVAILYSQGEDGSMRMRCTATAFEKLPTGYLFASAAHCVGNDDVQHERAAKPDHIPFYITFDEPREKTFWPAKALEVGYQQRGDDFFVFQVDTDKVWATIPLGDEQRLDLEKENQTKILNVASPLGLGRQVFRGTISLLRLDRPLVQSDINWRGSMLLAISAGPGSSGSAIVSEHQKAIVGFLVGHVGANVVAIPISKFKRFRELYAQGKYRYAPTAGLDPQ